METSLNIAHLITVCLNKAHQIIAQRCNMPRGRQAKGGHKGRNRRFMTEEEVRQQEEKKQREKEWKRKKGLGGDSDSESASDEDMPKPLSRGAPGDLPPSGSESEGEEEESSEDEVAEPKAKGVEGLIEVQNPNRMIKKVQKAKDVDVNAKVELTRREREEIERQRATQAYRKLHEAGKTDEARRDMARLAIIRQQREEAAKKREAERKLKEATAKNEKERSKN